MGLGHLNQNRFFPRMQEAPDVTTGSLVQRRRATRQGWWEFLTLVYCRGPGSLTRPDCPVCNDLPCSLTLGESQVPPLQGAVPLGAPPPAQACEASQPRMKLCCVFPILYAQLLHLEVRRWDKARDKSCEQVRTRETQKHFLVPLIDMYCFS